MIDRYLVRYFLAVVDRGNFSRAAAHCNVAQPTLSIGIAKLEREIGAPLFLRSNQRIQLTPAGSRFLVHARRIEAEFALAATAIVPAAAPRVLRLGILHTVPAAVVADGISAARATLADAPVELVYGSESELIARMGGGRVDVAVTLCERGNGRLLERPLRRERYTVTLPVDHPLAAAPGIDAEALAGEAMIVRRHCEALAQTSRFFTDRGVRPRFALRSRSDEQVLAMVAAGLGLTVMPAGFAHPGVAQVPLNGFDLERTLGFAFGSRCEHLLDAPPPVLRAIAQRMAG